MKSKQSVLGILLILSTLITSSCVTPTDQPTTSPPVGVEPSITPIVEGGHITPTLTPTETTVEVPEEVWAARDADEPLSIKHPATGNVPPANPALGDTWVRPTDGAVMVYVPAGTYQMGSSEAEIDDLLTLCDRPSIFCDRKLYEPEIPPHTVTLDHFWIDQFEVTNAQFVAYLNKFGNWREGGGFVIRFGQSYCRIQEGDGEYWVTEGAASHPVVMVSWYGAEAYCQWVGGRLPTEAEWEYAGRGPEAYTYPWGNDPPTLELTRFNSGSTVSVGGYLDGVSWCGAYDMAGNVWEWTADRFGRYPTWPQENPTGPASGTMRVLRGGGWHSPWQQIRLTFRLHDTASSSYNG